jgi:hypothetical protein
MLYSQRVAAGLAPLVLALFLDTAPVKAQFVCAGSADGNAPLTGAGATAAGSSPNFACGVPCKRQTAACLKRPARRGRRIS